RHERSYLGGQIAAVNGELAPKAAGFPPAVVGHAITEAHQHAQDNGVEQARRCPPIQYYDFPALHDQAADDAVAGYANQGQAQWFADVKYGKGFPKRPKKRALSHPSHSQEPADERTINDRRRQLTELILAGRGFD